MESFIFLFFLLPLFCTGNTYFFSFYGMVWLCHCVQGNSLRSRFRKLFMESFYCRFLPFYTVESMLIPLGYLKIHIDPCKNTI